MPKTSLKTVSKNTVYLIAILSCSGKPQPSKRLLLSYFILLQLNLPSSRIWPRYRKAVKGRLSHATHNSKGESSGINNSLQGPLGRDRFFRKLKKTNKEKKWETHLL